MKIVFEKRKSISVAALFLVPAVSFLVSLVLTGLVLLAFGTDPVATFGAMVAGAFGSSIGFSETLVKAIPLMLTGLGVALAFKLKFWNIGAEGQLVLGGIASAWVALFLGIGFPQPFSSPRPSSRAARQGPCGPESPPSLRRGSRWTKPSSPSCSIM